MSAFGEAQASPVLVVEDDAGVRDSLDGQHAQRMQGRVERFQVLPKPIAAELLEHAVAAAV